MKDLDRLIDAVQTGAVVRSAGRARCTVCRQPDLARMITRWLDRRAKGDVLPCLQTMTDQLFRAVGAGTSDTIRRHIRYCLHRDHRTGRPLGEA